MAKSKYEKINFREIVKQASEKTGMKKSEVETAGKAIIEAIRENAQNGLQVNVKGLGKFFGWKKPARVCRNPRTGEKVSVPEKKIAKFSPIGEFSDSVKKAINE